MRSVHWLSSTDFSSHEKPWHWCKSGISSQCTNCPWIFFQTDRKTGWPSVGQSIRPSCHLNLQDWILSLQGSLTWSWRSQTCPGLSLNHGSSWPLTYLAQATVSPLNDILLDRGVEWKFETWGIRCLGPADPAKTAVHRYRCSSCSDCCSLCCSQSCRRTCKTTFLRGTQHQSLNPPFQIILWPSG